MSETALREKMARIGELLYTRGLAHGSAGNLSARLEDGGFLVTPTNSCLGLLDPARIARLDADGRHLAGDKPSKEAFLHLAVYRRRPQAKAVAHAHSAHCVAWSIRADTNQQAAFPPVTAYQVMRCGKTPLAPYYPPGDKALAEKVGSLSESSPCMLLAHHGPVAAGASLESAMYNLEEMEETAKVLLLVGKQPYATLNSAQIEELNRRFPS